MKRNPENYMKSTLLDEMNLYPEMMMSPESLADVLQGSNEICNVLQCEANEISFFSSPLALSPSEFPVDEFIEAFDEACLQDEWYEIKASLKSKPFYESPDTIYDHCSYYLIQIKGINVVVVEGCDGPYFYIKTSDFSKL